MTARRHANPTTLFAAGCAASFVVASYASVMVNFHANANWAAAQEANAFFRNVTSSRSDWTDPAVTVVPLRAPPIVAGEFGWAEKYGQQLFLLPLMAPGWSVGDLADRTIVLDSQGHIREVTLQSVASARPVTPVAESDPGATAPAEICSAPQKSKDGLHLSTSAEVQAGPMFARVTYRALSDGYVSAVVFDGPSYRLTSWPTSISAGEHTTLIPLPSGNIDTVRLSNAPAEEMFCVSSTDIVRPLLINPDGSCSAIDLYAHPTGVVNCPSRS